MPRQTGKFERRPSKKKWVYLLEGTHAKLSAIDCNSDSRVWRNIEASFDLLPEQLVIIHSVWVVVFCPVRKYFWEVIAVVSVH